MNEITPTTQEFHQSILKTPSSPSRKSLYRYLVEKIGHLLITNTKLKAVPTARKNLSLITQLPEDAPQITALINAICQNTIYSYVELFLDLGKGNHNLSKKIEVDQKGLERIRLVLAGGRGVVLAGAHTCGFDHAVFSLNDYLPGLQVLSKANPTGGNRFMFYLRKLKNVLITPISVQALKAAIGRLHSGGVVAVAIDLPIPNGECFCSLLLQPIVRLPHP